MNTRIAVTATILLLDIIHSFQTSISNMEANTFTNLAQALQVTVATSLIFIGGKASHPSPLFRAFGLSGFRTVSLSIYSFPIPI
jgi:hypothetical protein